MAKCKKKTKLLKLESSNANTNLYELASLVGPYQDLSKLTELVNAMAKKEDQTAKRLEAEASLESEKNKGRALDTRDKVVENQEMTNRYKDIIDREIIEDITDSVKSKQEFEFMWGLIKFKSEANFAMFKYFMIGIIILSILGFGYKFLI